MEVPLYITFHFINAYEERDEDGRVTAIVADCCEHNADTTILDKLRLNNLRTLIGQDVLPDARYTHVGSIIFGLICVFTCIFIFSFYEIVEFKIQNFKILDFDFKLNFHIS